MIDRLIIYTYGIVVDIRSSTQESQRLLEEAFEWGSKELGLVYKPTMIKRWQYASQVIFRSDFHLTEISPAVQTSAQKLAERISAITGEKLSYELTVLAIDYDQVARKHPLGRFSIQRRDNTPFSENKYFSEAPLQTDDHIALLEQFEADLRPPLNPLLL